MGKPHPMALRERVVALVEDGHTHSHKKHLQAAELKRPDVALARQVWIARRQPFMRNALERMACIDETSVKTNMVKTTGWAPVGARLPDHAPFGHGRTQSNASSSTRTAPATPI
ncbi:MAG: hypothetical protein AAGA71_17280 [Pseudomonadota bacterium]